VKVRVQLARWYLGLLGLGLLRGWPRENADLATARMDAMRALLEGRGDPDVFEIREYDVLDPLDAYAAWADTYDTPNPLIAAEERVIDEALGRFAIGRALDVATGTGRVAARLAALGHSTFAVDASAEMLARIHPDARAHVVRGDMLALPFAASSFDLITCSLALTHLPDLHAVISAFARVLRPGGSVVVADIHPLAVATGSHAFFQRSDGSRAVAWNEVHWPSSYIDAAIDAGLAVRRCQEVLVDEELLREFASEDRSDPEYALEGLPWVVIWTFSKNPP
jgi:SAM-dependent methyltransferase